MGPLPSCKANETKSVSFKGARVAPISMYSKRNVYLAVWGGGTGCGWGGAAAVRYRYHRGRHSAAEAAGAFSCQHHQPLRTSLESEPKYIRNTLQVSPPVHSQLAAGSTLICKVCPSPANMSITLMF